jgi:predicted transcriptional regulator
MKDPVKPCPKCNGTGKIQDDVLVGKALRKERTEMGLHLREVARRMGLSAAYVSDLEKGRRIWRGELIARYRKAVNS